MALPVDSPPGGGSGGGTWHPGSGAVLYNNGSAVSGFDILSTSFTIRAGETADVFIEVFARQGYSSGLKSWGAAIIVDGVTIQTAGGSGGYTDCFSMAKGIEALEAGTHTFEFQWHAQDTTVGLNGVSANLRIVYR